MPGRRRGLGRGLDALLGETGAPPPVAELDGDEIALTELALEAIDPNPEQPRTDFDDDALAALAGSIRTHGLLHPIVVERGQVGRFRLIAGERRVRAARRAGLRTIAALVRPAAESTRDALELGLVENLQRADLSPIEEATAYQRLGDAFGLSAEAIGLRVGKSRPAVANTLRLLGLPPAVQLALRERRLTAGHARALLALPQAAAQEALASRAEREGMTVRDVEHAVATQLVTGAPSAARRHAAQTPPASSDDRALCTGLELVLGTPVHLERRRRGGRLVVEFYDDDQLGGLYTAMGGRPL